MAHSTAKFKASEIKPALILTILERKSTTNLEQTFTYTDFTLSFKNVLMIDGKICLYMGVNQLKEKRTTDEDESCNCP
jgi:hypothetical protein